MCCWKKEKSVKLNLKITEREETTTTTVITFTGMCHRPIKEFVDRMD